MSIWIGASGTLAKAWLEPAGAGTSVLRTGAFAPAVLSVYIQASTSAVMLSAETPAQANVATKGEAVSTAFAPQAHSAGSGPTGGPLPCASVKLNVTLCADLPL